ncbi:GAF domain-containing protein [Actinomycetospora endophytica]|uniref:GAF domain-containing protein n=1 Tax=Actinomycetospora endophytica TaxID=2291215 RepID=A0ABS8PBB7_9PSEU|nr:GAF domain-containing protein [Actinomycetospora endophytica]MCD2195565.1 GAF domain-containing protein [Actinomycetospora endophytica]
MVDLDRLDRALVAAVRAGTPDSSLKVCRACVSWLPMTGVAITIMSELQGAQEPVCATDPGAARIDELQFSLGDGPCVESFTTGRAVLVDDIAAPAEGRWPMFAAAASAAGARGLYVFPLHVGASRIGVLDCYRNTPGPLAVDELAGALRAADAAVWTLLDQGERGTDADDGTAGNEGAEGWFAGHGLARAEVHQATGMLCAQAGVPPPAALARLRAAAFTQERPITAIAGDVLARRLRLDPDGIWLGGEDGEASTTDDTTGTGDRGIGLPDHEDPAGPASSKGDP